VGRGQALGPRRGIRANGASRTRRGLAIRLPAEFVVCRDALRVRRLPLTRDPSLLGGARDTPLPRSPCSPSRQRPAAINTPGHRPTLRVAGERRSGSRREPPFDRPRRLPRPQFGDPIAPPVHRPSPPRPITSHMTQIPRLTRSNHATTPSAPHAASRNHGRETLPQRLVRSPITALSR